MKRYTLIPSMLVICFAGPVLAQQGSVVSEQDAQQAANTISKKFETVYNAGDGAAIASLFAEGGTYLTPGGTVLSDRQAMEKAIAGRIKAGWTNETVKVTAAHAAGNAVWAIGEYSIVGTGQNSGKQISGHFAEMLTRSGPEWRFIMLMANLTPSQDITGMAATAAPSK